MLHIPVLVIMDIDHPAAIPFRKFYGLLFCIIYISLILTSLCVLYICLVSIRIVIILTNFFYRMFLFLSWMSLTDPVRYKYTMLSLFRHLL